MPLSLSQEDNVVDNRPLPSAKATGAEAVAAFRAGQASAKKSKAADTPASASKDNSSSASKDKEKKKRKSTAPVAPTSPPHSPAPLPTSPPPSGSGSGSGSGRKRKASAIVQPAPAEEKDDADEDENPSPLDAALADFVPASLAPLPSTAAGRPMWLFQFPAKFDVAAFSALQLSLPTATSASRIISRFQLNGEHYRIIEAEPSESTDIINLFPSNNNSTHNLTPGQPFTRLLRITLDLHTPTGTSTASASATSGWQHSAAALKRKTAVPPAKGLVVHFRPIGWMEEGDAGQEVGERRGRGFKKVAYEEEGSGEGKEKEKKRRKKEEKREKENEAVVVQEREDVSEKKKKRKKDKDRQKESK